jgi:hypothetical protein
MSLSQQQEEQLIELFSENPHLCNTRDNNYKNKLKL